MRRQEPTARLLNDTKWREILELTLAMSIRYEVAFTWDDQYHEGLASKSSLHPHAVGDPGLSGGGPHKYSEIASIRVARFSKTRNSRTGALSPDESLSLRYLKELALLGQIPFEVCDEYVYVHGYAAPDP